MTNTKVTPIIIIGLLTAIAAAGLAVFTIEKGRYDLELREWRSKLLAAEDGESYQAWHYAAQYETFRTPLSNSLQEPRASSTYTSRRIWVKAFQRTDVKLIGRSQKYGNGAYQVTYIIGFNDRASEGLLRAVAADLPINVFQAAVRGEWHYLSVQCKVEKMDGPGDWIASDWKFAPITYNGDFPFVNVRGEQ
jgi:hypothetical protein